MPQKPLFDKAYYDRFYQERATCVGGQKDIDLKADFVHHYLKFLGIRVSSAIDVGCGLGHWQKALKRLRPACSYTGVEYSEYLCAEYGWINSSIVKYKSDRRFDLVICQDVLQYLDNKQAKKAIKNLASLSNRALYLQVMTNKDWKQNANQKLTDGNVFLHKGKWYRRQLAKYFLDAGGGLFIHRRANPVFWELEARKP